MTTPRERRPRILDLCCCAGGAAVGYQRAGWNVDGVDQVFKYDYPFRMRIADAVDSLRAMLVYKPFFESYDAIHISPPCQRYATGTKNPDKHPDLVPVVQELLDEIGKPYIIENVPGAPLRNPVQLCGSGFGLGVRRHRHFESNVPLVGMPCDHESQGTPIGVYGDHPDRKRQWRPTTGTSRGVRAATLAEGREAMGIDWMDWKDLTQAIPPAYTEHLGRQLLQHCNELSAEGLVSA